MVPVMAESNTKGKRRKVLPVALARNCREGKCNFMAQDKQKASKYLSECTVNDADIKTYTGSTDAARINILFIQKI